MIKYTNFGIKTQSVNWRARETSTQYGSDVKKTIKTLFILKLQKHASFLEWSMALFTLYVLFWLNATQNPVNTQLQDRETFDGLMVPLENLMRCKLTRQLLLVPAG